MTTQPRKAPAPRAEPVKRMRRAERREQILDAATRAFARAGFAATGLDDVCDEAGVTRVMLYRHFESKADMYRAVLDRACTRLAEAVGGDNFDDDSIPALVRAASADPEGFRLLFRHAAREPDFRELVDTLTAASREVTRQNLARRLPPGPWLDWASGVIPVFTTEAVISWLDSGQPDPERAADRIRQAVHGIIHAAHPSTSARPGGPNEPLETQREAVRDGPRGSSQAAAREESR